MAINDDRSPPSGALPRSRARAASGRRGRHGHELAAASESADTARLRARAERAEAALAEQRRLAARAIRGLRTEVVFWRLRAEGVTAEDAAVRSGLTDIPR